MSNFEIVIGSQLAAFGSAQAKRGALAPKLYSRARIVLFGTEPKRQETPRGICVLSALIGGTDDLLLQNLISNSVGGVKHYLASATNECGLHEELCHDPRDSS